MRINTFLQKNKLHGCFYRFFSFRCKALSILFMIVMIISCSRFTMMQVYPYKNQLSESLTAYPQQANISLNQSVHTKIDKKIDCFVLILGALSSKNP